VGGRTRRIAATQLQRWPTGVPQSAQEKLLGGEMGVVGNGGGGEQCASSIFGSEEVGETDVGWWRNVVPFYI
jgi:hypothetical protein